MRTVQVWLAHQVVGEHLLEDSQGWEHLDGNRIRVGGRVYEAREWHVVSVGALCGGAAHDPACPRCNRLP